MIVSNIIPALLAVFSATISPVPQVQADQAILSSHSMSLEKRYANEFVNDVFKDNILLTLDYMRGEVSDKAHINWNQVEKPFHYEFSLKPHENFTFHDDVLPEYKGNVTKTTHADFSSDEGFKSDGYLIGDGVCHLASLIYWSAKDAGLDAKAPTNHDFANIPEVPREYGVAIYDSPENVSASALQNLYITNNKDKPVTFSFDYKNNILTVKVVEEK